ncbi:MAG TPA: DNA alkylation repair protein [Bacteroidales bacterium]|nr:DNA alkylation repair protein [Bacteroidales bacterium]
MNADQLISEIIQYCEANANPETAAKSQRFFKEPHEFYGLSSPQITSKVKQLLKTPGINLETVIQATNTLVKSPKYEVPAFGLLLINGMGKQFTKETFASIASWYTISIDNWAHADALGMMVLPQFMLKGIVNISAFKQWIVSPYKFQRRSVPVTLIKVLKNNKTADFTQYFAFIKPLMTDKEREVHQGVGWFLREAWKIQPEPTEKFLLKWKDKAPRLIIQYATEKMTKENKERFKRFKA